MSILLSEGLDWLSEPKQLINLTHWESGNDKQANRTWALKSRIQTQKTIPRGLWFRVTVWEKWPNVAVIQLECDLPIVRAHIVLYRFELNPFGTHTNFGDGPRPLADKFIDSGVNHEHSYGFYEGMPDLTLVAGWDPFADIVSDPIDDLDAALDYVCAKLNISNRSGIVMPQLQSRLV
jgi:hypothetical protein